MGISKPYVAADTKLSEIAWLSAQNPDQVYYSLMHHINVDSLRACFNQLNGLKAVGIDRISKDDYGKHLGSNLAALMSKMKQMKYQPQPVRQVQIPKEGKPGATRPLGISCFEDKLVQKRIQEILESIYEPIFLPCSYGFRPNRGCHDAIKDLHDYLYANEVETVIDVDLANFFGTIDHLILKDFLQLKIKDTKFMRYITRLLRAGVLANGELTVSDEGSVQGSCASPVLANVMAHYVIDVWLEDTVKPLLIGSMRAFRYADDLVIVCQYDEDAERVKRALEKRLAKYKLQMNVEKTKMVGFSKRASAAGKPQASFDFLGFTVYLGLSRNGKVIPKVKTIGKRFRSKLKKVGEWAKSIRSKATMESIWERFCSKLQGHIQYYGVSHNNKAVATFRYEAIKIMFKWLNRRSQRRSFNWEKFQLFMDKYPPPPAKIIHKLFEKANINKANVIVMSPLP